MKSNWFVFLCSLCIAALGATDLQAVPSTGSWGWGFGSVDPAGPYTIGYSDNGTYTENAYPPGGEVLGAIQTDAWQTLTYTVDKSVPGSPTITPAVSATPGSTSAYGTLIIPTDIYFFFGDGVNGVLRPFDSPIYVRNLELKLDGVTVALQDFSSYSIGDNLLDGSHAEWTDPYNGGGTPVYVATAPGGSKAAAITDANGFPGGFGSAAWTFPALTQTQFDDADALTFSIEAYWASEPVPPSPIPPTVLTPDNLVSVDFVTNDSPTSFLTPASGNTTVSAGPNQNADAIIFSGQNGAWNAFTIGGNNTNETSQGPSANLQTAAGGPTTIQFSMDAATTWRDNFVTSDGALRNDAAYLYASAITGDSLNWHITGLDPSQTYSLVVFGTDPNNSSNTANGILGYLDDDGDYNWLAITPNAQGEIHGVFTYLDVNSETTPGIQGFQLGWSIIPEPSSFALLGIAAAGVMRFNRRRRA